MFIPFRRQKPSFSAIQGDFCLQFFSYAISSLFSHLFCTTSTAVLEKMQRHSSMAILKPIFNPEISVYLMSSSWLLRRVGELTKQQLFANNFKSNQNLHLFWFLFPWKQNRYSRQLKAIVISPSDLR